MFECVSPCVCTHCALFISSLSLNLFKRTSETCVCVCGGDLKKRDPWLCFGRIRYSEGWWDKIKSKWVNNESIWNDIVNECCVSLCEYLGCMHSYLTVRVRKHPGEDFTQPLQLHPTADQQQTQLDENPQSISSSEKQIHSFCGWPEGALVLEQRLQAQQPLLPLWPVGTGTTVQHLARTTNVDKQRSVTSKQRK